MSDIDKLRALVEAQWQCDAYHVDGCECVEPRDALRRLAPALLAVVEAARAVSTLWESDQVPHDTARDDVATLDAAIDALDARLAEALP